MFIYISIRLFLKAFLGEIRDSEITHLESNFFDKLVHLVIFLFIVGISDKTEAHYLLVVSILIYSLTSLGKKRVEYIIAEPLEHRSKYLRVGLFLVIVFYLNFVVIAYLLLYEESSRVKTIFVVEHLINCVELFFSFLNLFLLFADGFLCRRPWANRGAYISFVTFISETLVLLLTLGQMIKILSTGNLVFHLAFRIISQFMALWNKVYGFLSLKILIKSVEKFPKATEEEIEEVRDTCVFCYEEFDETTRKISCGHMFHEQCLKDWFQNDESIGVSAKCPTCRQPISTEAVPQHHYEALPTVNTIEILEADEEELVNYDGKFGALEWGLPQPAVPKTSVSQEMQRRRLESMNQFLVGFYTNPPEPDSLEDTHEADEIQPVPDMQAEEQDQPIEPVLERGSSRIPDHVLRRYESRDN